MASLNFYRRGDGEPLVLLHGIGSRWQMWQPVIERLAAERDVVAVDLPGFGFSPPPPPGTEPGAASIACAVAGLLDELELERPHVAGNSLGGWTALELAKRGRARSVTALSPAGFYTQAEAVLMFASLRLTRDLARWARPEVAALLARPGARHLLAWQLVAGGERIPAFDLAENLRALADSPWFDATLDAITRERFFAGRSLGVPVTVAWGEHDRLLRHRQAARVPEQIPDAWVTTLRGCGHVPTYDDPGRVAEVLLAGSARG